MGRPRSSFATLNSLSSQRQFANDLISRNKPGSPLTQVLARLISARLGAYSKLRRDTPEREEADDTKAADLRDKISRLCDAYERAADLERRYVSDLPALQDLHFERYSYLYGEYLLDESKPDLKPCDHRHQRDWANRFRARRREEDDRARRPDRPSPKTAATAAIDALYELLGEELPGADTYGRRAGRRDIDDALHDYAVWDLGDPGVVGGLIRVWDATRDLAMIGTRFPRAQAHMVAPFRYAIGHCLEHEFGGLYVDAGRDTAPGDAQYERRVLGLGDGFLMPPGSPLHDVRRMSD